MWKYINIEEYDFVPQYTVWLLRYQKKIVYECGNVAEPGFIERKKNVTLKQATQINNNHQCNIPRCPTCGSINIKKITGLSKVGSVALWGVLSRKVHKQWHCNNCGSEW